MSTWYRLVSRLTERGHSATRAPSVELRMENFRLRAEVSEARNELKRLNRELYEMQRRGLRAERQTLARHMTARFAHKIGTPLNLISGYLQLLRESRPDDGELQSKLRPLSDQIDKLTASVREVLDEARKPVHQHLPIRLSDLIRRILLLLEPSLDARGIRLELDLAQRDDVRGDEAELEQAFLSLFNNALDAMPDGGVLTIRTEATLEEIRSVVADTGAGIDDDHLPRVFEAFFTTKGAGRGTGLGLSIVKDIVTGHRGTVHVESEPGRGTRFVLCFPRDPADPA